MKPGIFKTELITREQENSRGDSIKIGSKTYAYQCADAHYDQALIDAAMFRKMGFFTKIVKSTMLREDGKFPYPDSYKGKKDKTKDGRPTYFP